MGYKWKCVSVLLILGTTMIFSGCNLVDKTVRVLVSDEGTPPSKTQAASAKDTGDKANVGDPVTEIGGGQSSQIPLTNDSTTSENKSADPKTIPETKTAKIVLYFTNKQGNGLAQESRVVEKVPGMAKKSLEELIKGPAGNKDLSNSIPKGAVVRDLNIKPDGLAIVDFSKELKVKHPGGSAGEVLTVYSIVNTLTQFSSVQKVQILIEGESVETLAGHVDLSAPLERNPVIIK